MNRLCAALLCGSVIFPARAQSELTSDIVVTASRTASLPVLHIDAARITRLQTPSLLETLTTLPAVMAFHKNGLGGGSYLSIEGGEPNYTLVLIDGVRVTDPSNAQGGAFDFAQISPMLVAGIDVASGAQSAVQGPDALAGVVHVRLRDVAPQSRNVMLQINGDSESALSGDVALDYGWDNGGLLLGAHAMTSGDLSPGAHVERQQYIARAQQNWGDLSMRTLLLRADSQRYGWPEDSGDPRLVPDQPQETRDTHFTLASLQVEGAATQEIWPRLRFSWMEQQQDQRTPAIAAGVYDGVPAINSDTRFTRMEASVEIFWQAAQALRLALGGATLEEEGRGQGMIDFGFAMPVTYGLRRTLHSLFGEARLAHGDAWMVQASVRMDAPSNRGKEVHGSVYAQATPFTEGPRFHARWSQGFKQPSIYALAYPLIANPALRPERGESYELGVDMGEGDARLSVSGFHHRFTDMIDFDPARFTNVNRSQVTIRGIKALGTLQIGPQWQIEGSGSWMDVQAPVVLRSRPRWMGQARLLWSDSARGLGWDMGVRHVGAHWDSSVATGLLRRDGWWVADTGVIWTPNAHIRLDLRLNNLLNSHYEEAVGFPAPRRHLRLGLRLHM